MAREATAKGKREAAVELKAAAARVATEAAAREAAEAEAKAQQEVLEVMALEVHVLETSTPARRYCCSLIC